MPRRHDLLDRPGPYPAGAQDTVGHPASPYLCGKAHSLEARGDLWDPRVGPPEWGKR
jgi:hypothetical protein